MNMNIYLLILLISSILPNDSVNELLVNEYPIWTEIPMQYIDEDCENGCIDGIFTFDLEPFIEDPDGETEFTVLVSDGDNYSVIDNASILPFENFNGTISVNTQVEDAEGSLSDIYPVLVTINPVNDAPMVSDLQLNPSLPGLDDDVNLSYSYYDPEDNTESVE